MVTAELMAAVGEFEVVGGEIVTLVGEVRVVVELEMVAGEVVVVVREPVGQPVGVVEVMMAVGELGGEVVPLVG